MKRNVSTLILLCIMCLTTMAQSAYWKSYLSYAEPTETAEASKGLLYVLASGGLYKYNSNDQSIQTYDKTTIVNDCDIAHIAWCQAEKKLVIVYNNGNIDLLGLNDQVVNIAEYKNKQMTSDKTIHSIDVSGTSAYLATGFGLVQINVKNGEVTNTYQLDFQVNHSYIKDGYLYAASSTNGLYRGLLTDNLLNKSEWKRVGEYTPNEKTISPQTLSLIKTLKPGGPKYNYFGFMKMHNGQLYTCNGQMPNEQPACIQVLKDDQWTIFPSEGITEKTGLKYHNLYCLAFDPKDPQHIMAGGRNGLYEYKNGLFTAHYNHKNSPIQPYNRTNQEYELIKGAIYTRDGKLWILNSPAPERSILAYTTDKQWEQYDQPTLMKLDYENIKNGSLGDLRNMMTDSRGLVWFVNNHWHIPSLYAYDTVHDKLYAYTSFVNEDNTKLSMKYVRCVSEDALQNIWVGTDVGPLMLTPNQVNETNPVFTQVKVPRNDGSNYADYLLSGVDVSCIAIDQANRKWFGTNGNGVYLISADNISEIHHFTAANSSLLSDNILSIAINPTTDEVFFGTEKGLCSYKSNAKSAVGGMTKDNVYAYPNPVHPDYLGAITITGLEEQSDIKIVTSNGTLVHEGKATGRQYKWYGLDQEGRRVASGVYMVQVATKEGDKGVVCKIAIIR